MKLIKTLFGTFTIALGLFVQAQAQTFLTNGLVTYFPFDGNAEDVSGNGNNGHLAPDVGFTADRWGTPNSALSFTNGTRSGVTTTVYQPAPNDFSLCLWFNIPTNGYGQLIGFYGTQSGDATEYDRMISYSDGILDFFLYPWRTVHLSTPTAVDGGTWHHAVATLSPLGARLFVDGALVVEDATITYSADYYSGWWRVGNYLDGSASADEVRIYNRALSDSEVQQLYTLSAAPKILVQPASQVAYWGNDVSFTVRATGPAPLSYQWYVDGSAIPWATNSIGGTNSSLTLTNLALSAAGEYWVVVANAYGTNTSDHAYLVVNPAGVGIALYAGVTIDGVVGQTYGVQSTTDLSNTNSWVGRTNLTLTVPTSLWYDSQPATQPQTYYRVLPGPISIP